MLKEGAVYSMREKDINGDSSNSVMKKHGVWGHWLRFQRGVCFPGWL